MQRTQVHSPPERSCGKRDAHTSAVYVHVQAQLYTSAAQANAARAHLQEAAERCAGEYSAHEGSVLELCVLERSVRSRWASAAHKGAQRRRYAAPSLYPHCCSAGMCSARECPLAHPSAAVASVTHPPAQCLCMCRRNSTPARRRQTQLSCAHLQEAAERWASECSAHEGSVLELCVLERSVRAGQVQLTRERSAGVMQRPHCALQRRHVQRTQVQRTPASAVLVSTSA